MGMLKAEVYKIRHTLLPLLYLIFPMFFALTYFVLAKITGLKNFSPDKIIQTYLIFLATLLPIFIAVVSSKVSEMEKGAGNFQVFLIYSKSREKSYLAKLLVMILGGLISIAIAVLSFCFLYGNQNLTLCIVEILLIFLGSLGLFVIHQWTALMIGTGASLGLGFLGTLLSFLSLTSQGDKVWYFLPSCRSSRLVLTYLVGKNLSKISLLRSELIKWLPISLSLSVLFLLSSLIWFKNWDGKSSID